MSRIKLPLSTKTASRAAGRYLACNKARRTRFRCDICVFVCNYMNKSTTYNYPCFAQLQQYYSLVAAHADRWNISENRPADTEFSFPYAFFQIIECWLSVQVTCVLPQTKRKPYISQYLWDMSHIKLPVLGNAIKLWTFELWLLSTNNYGTSFNHIYRRVVNEGECEVSKSSVCNITPEMQFFLPYCSLGYRAAARVYDKPTMA